jgi:hypothetical protein
MSEYEIAYGFLKLVRFPKEFGVVPAFKEEQMKLEKDEVEFLLEQLEKYRKQKHETQE